MRLCLDSTFLSDFVRGRPAALQHMETWATEGDSLQTTEICVFEVMQGIELETSPTRKRIYRENLAGALSEIGSIGWNRQATELGVARQVELRREGRPSEFTDLMIAALAKSAACDRIVTSNARDFERIGLVPLLPVKG